MTAIDTRNLKRDSLFFMAGLRREGAAEAERVKIRNLSDGGMMVESTAMLRSGERVMVELRNIGSVMGKVAWTQGSRVGVAFEEPINASLARTQLVGEHTEAPRYARPAVAPRNPDWNIRRV